MGESKLKKNVGKSVFRFRTKRDMSPESRELLAILLAYVKHPDYSDYLKKNADDERLKMETLNILDKWYRITKSALDGSTLSIRTCINLLNEARDMQKKEPWAFANYDDD